MNTAKRVFDEVRIMPESEAREVLDFVGYLKAKRERTSSLSDFHSN